MRSRPVIVACVLAASMLFAAASAAAAADPLLGTWRVTGLVHDGKAVPMAPGLVQTFDIAAGGQLTVTSHFPPNEPVVQKGTWRQAGKTLHTTIGGHADENEITRLDATRLTLTKGKQVMEFTRQTAGGKPRPG